MAGLRRSAWACLALVAAAVLASEEPRSPGGSSPQPGSSVVVASSTAAASKDNKDSYEQLELGEPRDPEEKKGVGLCAGETQHAAITLAIYCGMQQASECSMKKYLISTKAFWICLPLAIFKSTLWYRLPFDIDLPRLGALGVFLEAVVTANICFNDGNLLPTWVPFMAFGRNPIELAISFCMVLALLRFYCLWQRSKSQVASRGRRASDGLVIFDNEYVVSSRYEDLTTDFLRVFVTFFVQVAAVLFYFFHLNAIYYLSPWGKASFINWFLGVCIVWCRGVDEMGASFDVRYWWMVFKKVDTTIGIKSMRQVEVRVRCLMAFVVNGIFLTFIRGTFPIILATRGHWGFVTDCMAVFFVTSLDDLPSGPRPFEHLKDIVPFVGETNSDCDAKEDTSTSELSDAQSTDGTDDAWPLAAFLKA